MKENVLKIISTLVVIFLLAYAIMSFINSSSKTNDPNHTSLGSGIVYLFALTALAYITFVS